MVVHEWLVLQIILEMKLYVIAGEPSGDLHGSNLIQAIQDRVPQAEIRGTGGDLMQAKGCSLDLHIKEMAFMGFVEVIKNLGAIRRNFRIVKEAVQDWQPDAIILIDYPGFNLRIAKWVKQFDIPVYYYISPQVWAWKANRVHTISRLSRRVLTILPFEKDFYAKYNYQVDYVGHPLVDVINSFESDPNFKAKYNLQNGKPIIALLPGSRKQEIQRLLKVMIASLPEADSVQVLLAGAPTIDPSIYEPFLSRGIQLVQNDTYNILAHADAALVTSGTATLETALFNVPQVVCYKADPISVWIARRLIKIKFISLVNLIANKLVVRELIQAEAEPHVISTELALLFEPTNRKAILNNYKQLQDQLHHGGASERTAEIILDDLASIKK